MAKQTVRAEGKPSVSKFPLYLIGTIVITFLLVFEFFLVKEFVCTDTEKETETTQEQEKTSGIMIMIEYKDTVGLVNFVNELQKRDIKSMLLATPEFVSENCSTIKKLTEYDVEIIGSHTDAPFWDMPYQKQYDRIKTIKTEIEKCTGKPLKIVGSRFFASDENTVKAAENLGIPYVTARGTTETRATVYKPEEYDVKMFSVSNIQTVAFKYGSLCDYSYWVRQGKPEDMKKDMLEAVEKHDQISPVSHTNIGGYYEDWLSMWQSFWDTQDIEWKSLDEIMANVDYTFPYWRIPQNRNAPYTPQMLQHVEGEGTDADENIVENPCAIDQLPDKNANSGNSDSTTSNGYVGEKLVMYHNGTGPMCLDAVNFTENLDYTVEEHLTTESDFYDNLNELKETYGTSEGVSRSFDYYPIIFIKDKAFSGFNDEVKEKIENEIKK